jgi:hypothetical protein
MKRACAVVLITILLAPSAAAQSIAESGRRQAMEVGQGQGVPTAVPGGGRGMVWGGLALAGAGATLAILAGTAMKSEGDAYDVCMFLFGDSDICADTKETNKGLLWTGIGMAGAGATLATIGATRSSATSLVRVRRGLALQHKVSF